MNYTKFGPEAPVGGANRAGVINQLASRFDAPVNTAEPRHLQVAHVRRHAAVSQHLALSIAALCFAIPEKWGRDNG